MAISDGNAFALGELPADDMAGAFRRDHDHVHVGGRHDGLEVDGEAVGEEERLALCEVRRDVRVIHGGDLRIGHGDENHVRPLDRFGGIDDLEAFFLGYRAGLAAGVKADDDLDPAVLEVERVGVALGAEADNGAGLAFKRVEGRVFVGINLCCHNRIEKGVGWYGTRVKMGRGLWDC